MTTTETPSVDGPTPDALSEQESRAMTRVLAWYGSIRGSHAQFYREVDDLRLAGRAEAMTEDARHWQEIAEGYLATLESVGEETGHLEASLAEAVGLLRAVEWKAAVELIIGGWGLGCPSCGSPADDLDMSEHYPDCPLDAFLSRFPEAAEGGE